MNNEIKEYKKPELKIHGSLNDLTKGGGTIPGEPHGDPSI